MRPSELDIWILAGQSNMQGCGMLQGIQSPDERVWTLTSAGNWEVACEPLHRLWESYTPVHSTFMRQGMQEADMTKPDDFYAAAEAAARKTGSGLGMAFGVAMTEATGRPVGLVPAAHGGTSLDQWHQKLKDEGGASLYGAMLDRTERALKDGGTLRGVLWYQGESDAVTGIAETYLDRFAAWIEALRTDLDRPDLPVYIVQIGCVTTTPAEAAARTGWQERAWEAVRQALLDVPGKVPHTATVPTIDLGLVDSIHIDTEGLIRLGRRLARVAQHRPTPSVTKIVGYTHYHGVPGARLICDGVTGGWQPRFHISGFSVRTPEGKQHPDIYVMNANADPDDPTHILVQLNAPANDGALIGYGLGLDPYCNCVDEADMALPSFAAMKVEL